MSPFRQINYSITLIWVIIYLLFANEDFLKNILNLELSERTENSIQRKIKEAHFPHKFTLNDFKRDHLSIEIRC